jgi:tellurite resistance protein TehA-like permease
MNTGILSIILHQNPQPYNGSWLQICSTILYVLDLVLFFTILPTTLLRTALYPHTLKPQSASAVESVGFTGCMPIAAFTLVAQTALIPAGADWNGTGAGFALAAYVLWWICVAWVVLNALGVLVFVVRQPVAGHEALPTSLLVTGVGTATAGVVGATVVTYGPGISAQLAGPVIIVSYLLVGIGVFWSLFLYPLFWTRFLENGWPEPEKMPSLAMLVCTTNYPLFFFLPLIYPIFFLFF